MKMFSELTRKEQQEAVGSESFQNGYMAGMDDPGFVDAKIPDTIPNPYPEGSDEWRNYDAGYRTAIA